MNKRECNHDECPASHCLRGPKQDAEVERLERELNEALLPRSEEVAIHAVTKERDQLRAEVERLKEKNMAWALGVEQNNTDIVDMQRDEFKRIIALTSDTEIQGLCKRAIATIEQTVPVIVQRDQLESERDQWRAVAEQAIHAIKVGIVHGYGLRIGDDVIDAYEKLKKDIK